MQGSCNAGYVAVANWGNNILEFVLFAHTSFKITTT